eukprot:2261482-Pleurochrysis_carterae.AAC.1
MSALRTTSCTRGRIYAGDSRFMSKDAVEDLHMKVRAQACSFSSAHVCVCKQTDAPLLCACIGSLWHRRYEDLALPGRQN